MRAVTTREQNSIAEAILGFNRQAAVANFVTGLISGLGFIKMGNKAQYEDGSQNPLTHWDSAGASRK